jgi:hypothetical protein
MGLQQSKYRVWHLNREWKKRKCNNQILVKKIRRYEVNYKYLKCAANSVFRDDFVQAVPPVLQIEVSSGLPTTAPFCVRIACSNQFDQKTDLMEETRQLHFNILHLNWETVLPVPDRKSCLGSVSETMHVPCPSDSLIWALQADHAQISVQLRPNRWS